MMLRLGRFGGIVHFISICCCLFPISIALNLYHLQVKRSIIVDDLGVFEALARGWQVFQKIFIPCSSGVVLFIAGSIIIGLILSRCPCSCLMLPLMQAFIEGDITSWQPFIAVGIFALCYSPIAWLITGILTTYTESVWTLTYLRAQNQRKKHLVLLREMRKFFALFLGLSFCSVLRLLFVRRKTLPLRLFTMQRHLPFRSYFRDLWMCSTPRRYSPQDSSPKLLLLSKMGSPSQSDSLNEIAIPLAAWWLPSIKAKPSMPAMPMASPASNACTSDLTMGTKPPADMPDDLSLVSQAGPVINHAAPADFIVGLDGFQPDMRTAAHPQLAIACHRD
jgi:hypothetical protein